MYFAGSPGIGQLPGAMNLPDKTKIIACNKPGRACLSGTILHKFDHEKGAQAFMPCAPNPGSV